MGEIALNPDICIRCDTAPPELGSWLCKACAEILQNPPAPERGEQGKPVGKWITPPPVKPGQQPIVPRKS